MRFPRRLVLNKWKIAALAAIVAGIVSLKGQTSNLQFDDTYSPAHSSIAEAVRHFFGIRREPVQPIAFVHSVHVEQAELTCTDCHIAAARGSRASIPDIRTCWACHEKTLTDHAEIKKVRAYHDKSQDIPWQRVFGWTEEAHVRFNHAPHIQSQVDCATCHGDVAHMTVATRAVEHTMEFCVGCHKQRSVSIDCVTCHY